ncbi:hypothetical protein PVBG_04815 [Plasmodium vivax Brazil I]|uniref:Variable surface protein Vir7-like protein n=1 Tax=Plasmodium vivax (strain Brazil I) TaxID=1033975 RepID=A0A0J9T0Q2_PLAV1|nr:hypothetical protein PVBG_04815 [Plasmodium vivax Brazil I]
MYYNKITFGILNVWTTYNDFDNDVDDYKSGYSSLCYYILKDNNEELIKYSDFCMKIMRNLGVYSVERKFYAPTFERCNMLYNWIYNSIEQNKITVDIINKCFKEYNSYMDGIDKPVRCSIKSYDEYYKEPKNITLLHIFESNMHIFKDILNGQNEEYKIPCRKIVCEFVKIYKNVYKSYCNDKIPKDDKRKNTCDKLNTFKTIYNNYFFQNEYLIYKVPSLGGSEDELGAICKVDEQLSATTVAAGPEVVILPNSDQSRGDNASKVLPPKEDHVENQVSPMSRSVSTAVGTVAGASSILALLYKVNKKNSLNCMNNSV